MDGAGRVLLRDYRHDGGQGASQPLVANLLKGIVDDYVSLTGQMPDTKVPAPGTAPSDQEFADIVEKYHYGVWWSSAMVMQLKSMAWWGSVMGGCSAIVWPNFKKRHAEIRFIGPDKVYGVMDMLDPFAYSSAVVVESFNIKSVRDYFPNVTAQRAIDQLESARQNYPNGSNGMNGRVEVVRWFDKNEVVTLLGREVTNIRQRSQDEKGKQIECIAELGRARHDLGVCTVVPFQNIMIPGEMRGMSDIEEAVGLNQHINFMLNADEEYVLNELYSPLVVVDPQKAPEDINPTSPNEVIAVNAGGSVSRLNSSGVGQQVMAAEMTRAQQLIEYVTGDPQIRTQGQMRGANSGRGIEKAQGPVFGRIDYRNDLNAYRLEKVNEISVMMTTAMFGDDEIHLFGRKGRGAMFKTTIHGSDLQNYVYNKVMYPPLMGLGVEGRITAMLQLLGGNDPLIDRRTAIELIGLTDHPDEMMKLIDADKKRMVAFQKELQQEAQPSGGEQPPGPADVLQKQAALQHGATTAPAAGLTPPTPPSPGGASPTGAPGGSAAPAPGSAGGGAAGPSLAPLDPSAPPTADVGQVSSGLEQPTALADQVRSIVLSVKVKAKTKVYLTEGKEKVVVSVTDFTDAKKVRRAVYPIFGSKVQVLQAKRQPEGATEVQMNGGGHGAGQGSSLDQGPGSVRGAQAGGL